MKKRRKDIDQGAPLLAISGGTALLVGTILYAIHSLPKTYANPELIYSRGGHVSKFGFTLMIVAVLVVAGLAFVMNGLTTLRKRKHNN